MKLRFCESQIEELEKVYLDDQKKEKYSEKRELENRLIALQSTVQDQGYMNFCQLRTLAEWKLPRTLHNIDKNDIDDNSLAFVEMITGQAFEAKPDWAKLMTLTVLPGVGESVASAILHFFDTADYPIMDRNAEWSVCLDWNSGQIYPLWQEYVNYCRKIANKRGIKMRTLDRALWKFPDTEEGKALRKQNEKKHGC